MIVTLGIQAGGRLVLGFADIDVRAVFVLADEIGYRKIKRGIGKVAFHPVAVEFSGLKRHRLFLQGLFLEKDARRIRRCKG